MYFDSRNKGKVLIELTEPQTELCISISGDNLTANNITLLPKARMTEFKAFCLFLHGVVYLAAAVQHTELPLTRVSSCVSLAFSRRRGGTS